MRAGPAQPLDRRIGDTPGASQVSAGRIRTAPTTGIPAHPAPPTGPAQAVPSRPGAYPGARPPAMLIPDAPTPDVPAQQSPTHAAPARTVQAMPIPLRSVRVRTLGRVPRAIPPPRARRPTAPDRTAADRRGAARDHIRPSRSCAAPKARQAWVRTALDRTRGSHVISNRRRYCIATAGSRPRRWRGRRYPKHPQASRRPRGTAVPCAKRSPPTPPPNTRTGRPLTRRRRNPFRSARTNRRAGVAVFPHLRRAGRRVVPAGRRGRHGPSANGICSAGSWSCSWCSRC